MPGLSVSLPTAPVLSADERALYESVHFQPLRSFDVDAPENSTESEETRAARRLQAMLSGTTHLPANWTSRAMRTNLARVFGRLTDPNPMIVELRDKLWSLKRDLPDAMYTQYLRNVPSKNLLLREAMRPSAEVEEEMALFAQRMRAAPFVIGMHIRTKHGDMRPEDEALLEPWDIDAFVECYHNWARSHVEGEVVHTAHEWPDDGWPQHVVFLASDSMVVRERVYAKLVDSGLLPASRFLSYGTMARDTHTGPPALHGAERTSVLRTYAEFFLFEHLNATLLTAFSSFGDAACDRAGIRDVHRFYINHSNCRSMKRGCIEPYVPQVCIFNPAHDHDHHDDETDEHGNPLAALRRIKELEDKLRERELAEQAQRDAIEKQRIEKETKDKAAAEL